MGQDRMDNRTVDSIGEGEALVINNTAPILGAEMLENFAKKNSYRRIRLEGSGWYYENQLHDMPDSNFFSSKKADLDIVSNYSDSDFYFLSFPATPEFAAKGKLSIDLSEIPDWNAEEYDLYRSLDGVLYRLKADYDETEKSLSITTDTLGSYFISNAKIPNGTALQNQRILNPDTGWTDTLQRAESVLRLALTADTL